MHRLASLIGAAAGILLVLVTQLCHLVAGQPRTQFSHCFKSYANSGVLCDAGEPDAVFSTPLVACQAACLVHSDKCAFIDYVRATGQCRVYTRHGLQRDRLRLRSIAKPGCDVTGGDGSPRLGDRPGIDHYYPWVGAGPNCKVVLNSQQQQSTFQPAPPLSQRQGQIDQFVPIRPRLPEAGHQSTFGNQDQLSHFKEAKPGALIGRQKLPQPQQTTTTTATTTTTTLRPNLGLITTNVEHQISGTLPKTSGAGSNIRTQAVRCGGHEAPQYLLIESVQAIFEQRDNQAVLFSTNDPATCVAACTRTPSPHTNYFERHCVDRSTVTECPGPVLLDAQRVLIGGAETALTASTLLECVDHCVKALSRYGFDCLSGMVFYEQRELNCVLNSVTRELADQQTIFYIENNDEPVEYFDLDCPKNRLARRQPQIALNADVPPVSLHGPVVGAVEHGPLTRYLTGDLFPLEPIWGRWSKCDSANQRRYRFRSCKPVPILTNCQRQSSQCLSDELEALSRFRVFQ